MPCRSRKEWITPAKARQILENNPINRHVTAGRVRQMARDMKAGRWILTGTPIVITASGILLDGQHRLLACILADTRFYTEVQRGHDDAEAEAIMSVIDTGKSRTVRDSLGRRHEPNFKTLATIVRLCWQYDNGIHVKPTHSEQLAWLDANPDVRLYASDIARAANRAMGVPAAPVGTAYYINARADQPQAAEFWRLAIDGANLPAGSPILAWRQWVARRRPRQHILNADWLKYNLKAMTLWYAGRDVAILQARSNEPMPRPWDVDFLDTPPDIV